MSRARPLPRWLGSALLFLASCVVTLLLVEGCSSLVLLGYDLAPGRQTGLTSRTHMQHDTLVGWINQPNASFPDLFGAGVAVRTNSRSYRGTAEYDSVVPAGRIRIVCSGDSFTFGYGVADEQSWCARLQTLDPRLETVNLGHSGFGIDQSYLLYRRDGLALQHDVHVFALVLDDVRRLTLARFIGYPKPYFRVEQDRLVLHNVPVPEPSRLALWHTYHQGAIARARTVEFGTRLLGRLRRGAAPDSTPGVDPHDLMLRLFDDLQRLSERQGNRFVVMLLDQNYATGPGEWRLQELLAEELSRRGIPFVDTWSRFRALPAGQLESLFDRRWNHYSAEGNDVIARELHAALTTLPELAAPASPTTPASQATGSRP